MVRYVENRKANQYPNNRRPDVVAPKEDNIQTIKDIPNSAPNKNQSDDNW